MALRLSSAELAAVESASVVLLSPFAYDSGESWRRAAAHAVEECIGDGASPFTLGLESDALSVYFDDESSTRRRSRRRKAIMRLLYPAYCAGVRTYIQFATHPTPVIAGAEDLAGTSGLTPREIGVAQLLRRGLSNREIATELCISVNTTRRHVERILLKLDVHTRLAAAAKLSSGNGGA